MQQIRKSLNEGNRCLLTPTYRKAAMLLHPDKLFDEPDPACKRGAENLFKFFSGRQCADDRDSMVKLKYGEEIPWYGTVGPV